MDMENNRKEIQNDNAFLQFLNEIKFDLPALHHEITAKHLGALRQISKLTNSCYGLFDFSKGEMIYYSANFGESLGYNVADYKGREQAFFASKIHQEDMRKLSLTGISILKLFRDLPKEEILSHKIIHEYRMLNSSGVYIRIVEQFQILELDNKSQLWLMMNVADISPNQSEIEECKSQLLNFKTGHFTSFDVSSEISKDLTKREAEILDLVRKGLLSKEISDSLSISVHTVNTHRQRIIKKLNANNSHEAILFASKHGLLS